MAGVDALHAGIDQLHISYDTEQYYTVMHCLLQAQRHGLLQSKSLNDREVRLHKAYRPGNAGAIEALLGNCVRWPTESPLTKSYIQKNACGGPW